MRLAWSWVSPAPPVPAEIPALAMTRSSARSRSPAMIQAPTASRSVTSMRLAPTAAPLARHSAATESSRARSRPPSRSRTPGAAYSRASAAPMPLDAPVMRMLSGACIVAISLGRSGRSARRLHAAACTPQHIARTPESDHPSARRRPGGARSPGLKPREQVSEVSTSSLTHSPSSPAPSWSNPNEWRDCAAADDRAGWNAKVARLFEYWLSIAPAGQLPGRQHFDPLEIAPIMPHVWMLDVIREDGLTRYRYRLVGPAEVMTLQRGAPGSWFHEVQYNARRGAI